MSYYPHHLSVLHNLMLYRHVAKTGDIKNSVITEEVGIAKGIRRIVAVSVRNHSVWFVLFHRRLEDDFPFFFLFGNLAKQISPPSRRESKSRFVELASSAKGPDYIEILRGAQHIPYNW